MLTNKSSLKHTNFNQFKETVWLDPTLYEQKPLPQLPLLGRGHSTKEEAGQAESDPECSWPKPPKKVMCIFIVFNSNINYYQKKKKFKIHIPFNFSIYSYQQY